MEWQRLGDILARQFAVSATAIDQALQDQAGSGLRIGEQLLEQGAVQDEELAQALALQSGLEYLGNPELQPSALELLERIPIGYAKQYRLIPLEKTAHKIVLAVTDPYDHRPLNDLTSLTGCRISLCLVSARSLLQTIHRGYEELAGGAQEAIEDIDQSSDIDLAGGLEPADLIDASDEAPVIRFVNSMLTKAYKERASDIHIEPFEHDLVIRYRIDGILYEVLRPPHRAQASIVSRLKIMANLDIAEKRLPQDGRLGVRIAGKEVDVRVSTLPTAFGERVVLRLLDKSGGPSSLSRIGIDRTILPRFEAMIRKSHGIVLVTGPTGAGKTSTLYSALSQINSSEKNIITVEDPIEYQLPGVGQIQVNPKIDLTFAQGLRSILRQDPDIIMVGEIRDGETAKIAVQAALTGHLVFSTLHTNDAAGALARLVEMGVEPFLASSALIGVLAQRLVRTICPHCREICQPAPALIAELVGEQPLPPGATFHRGRGCDRCQQLGFLGRTGIYELLVVDDSLRRLVTANADAATIRRQALANGMQLLRQSGLNKVLAGETTIEEVLRVTQEEG
ncbi:MAG: type II secretion system ATPase GspE [Desulfuromonadales bacterium]|nr:type II secretion system ATPase GspE [Desulfuromonadales bacterium]